MVWRSIWWRVQGVQQQRVGMQASLRARVGIEKAMEGAVNQEVNAKGIGWMPPPKLDKQESCPQVTVFAMVSTY